MTTVARYRVWDLPTRLSHWAIAVLVIVQFGSGLFDVLPMDWHLWCGYALLAAVLFRIGWGFVGSPSARFGAFLRGPGAVSAYARTLFNAQPSRWPGHNPLGGWSIVLMLSLTLAQSITGLFSESIDVIGPLAQSVDRATSRAAGDWHGWLYWPLLALVVLHIAAALTHLLHKRENLIAPIFGDGRLELEKDPGFTFAGALRALMVLAVAVAIVAAIALQSS
jgi:cytochrome b